MEAKEILEKNIKMRGLLDFGNYSCVGIPYENALNAVNEALRQPLVSGQVCGHKHIMHINSEIGWLCLDCRKFSDDKQTFR